MKIEYVAQQHGRVHENPAAWSKGVFMRGCADRR